MGNAKGARSGFARLMIGRPRVSAGVVWCCFGVAWILVAAIEEPTVTRFLLGAGWFALGTFYGVVALRDRKHDRGFYQRAAPARATDDGMVADPDGDVGLRTSDDSHAQVS